MMKTLIAILALIVSLPAMAQEYNPSGTPLYAKPVPCGGLPELILEFEKSEMYPIMGLGGFSWNEDGSTGPAVVIVVVDANGRHAVVEKNNLNYCLLSTGNVVEYNSDVLKQLMNWK